MIPGVDGFMYPNEVELQWSILIVLYPYITGLVAGAFILASLERLQIPPDLAAELVPIDPLMGEFRVHYAGFFDPGFGYGSGDINGTPAVLEVRAHGVPFLFADGQTVGRLIFEQLLAVPSKIYGPAIGSSYQRQGLSLSKQFRKL